MPSTALVPLDDLSDRFPLLSTDEEMREALEENMGDDTIGLHDLVRVTIPAGGATFWDVGGKPIEKLTGVIIWVAKHRSYWETKRGEGGSDGPPDCASEDALLGRGLYGVGSELHPTGKCLNCPMNEWTPDKDGKRRKPCKEQRRLVMMLEHTALPIQVQLPPTSLGVLRKKLMIPLTGEGIKYYEATVEIGLEKKGDGGNPYSVIVPKVTGRLDPVSASTLKAVGDSIRDSYLAQTADA